MIAGWAMMVLDDAKRRGALMNCNAKPEAELYQPRNANAFRTVEKVERS